MSRCDCDDCRVRNKVFDALERGERRESATPPTVAPAPPGSAFLPNVAPDCAPACAAWTGSACDCGKGSAPATARVRGIVEDVVLVEGRYEITIRADGEPPPWLRRAAGDGDVVEVRAVGKVAT